METHLLTKPQYIAFSLTFSTVTRSLGGPNRLTPLLVLFLKLQDSTLQLRRYQDVGYLAQHVRPAGSLL
jgi:hypothetical protein